MSASQNGWPVLPYGSPRLRTFTIPARSGRIRLTLRDGSAGFLLCHFLLWWAEVIEPLAGRLLDDWGHAVRDVRDSDDVSNHASGTAADANAVQHPLGVRGTLTARERARIWVRLRLYRGCLRHGAFYRGRSTLCTSRSTAPCRPARGGPVASWARPAGTGS